MQRDADDEPTDADADAEAAGADAADVDTATEGADGVDADEVDAGEADADESDADEADVDESDAVEADAEAGVDTEHVMNLTFVLTLLFGVPTVVVLSLFVPLDGWGEIIEFVVRVGAAIWFLTAVTLYVRERVRN